MTVETDTPATESASPVDRIAALLEANEAKPAPKAPQREVTAEDDEESPDPGEVEDDEPEESEESEDEGPEDEEEDDQPEGAKVEELQINGKKLKLPAEVAAEVSAYAKSLQSDYTRKTQEAAERRKFADAKLQEASAKLTEYERGLQIVEHALVATLPPEPTIEYLHENGSEAFLAAKAARDQYMQKLQSIANETQRIAQVKARQSELEMAQHLEAQRARVSELIPAWKDSKRAEADQRLIKSALKEKGFDDADIQYINFYGSAEHVAVLQEWASWRQLMTQKKAAKPVAPKVAQPGPSRTPQDTTRVEKAKQALRRTGGKDGSSTFLIGRLLEKRGIK